MTPSSHSMKYAFWLSEPSSSTVEIAAKAGYDTIVLDLEHGTFDLATLDWLFPLLKNLNLRSIAKVLGPQRVPIQQALDLGADAVAVPHIESASHAQEVSQYAKFPPYGTRSLAGGRTVGYGAVTSEWVEEQNALRKFYPMVEDPAAAEQVDEVLALPNVDGIFVGPGDLHLLAGHKPFTADTEQMECLGNIAQAANVAGKPWILPAWGDAEKRLALELGAETVVTVMHHVAIFQGLLAPLERMRSLQEGSE